MPHRQNQCILVAEAVGGGRLVAKLGAVEAAHAVERCMHRVDLCIEAHAGNTLQRTGERACASFARCDDAAAAASDMLERILSLPPVSGVRLALRVGMHYGAVRHEPSLHGEGIDVAAQLAAAAHPGQALVSGAAVMLLSPGMRHLAGSEASAVELDGLEWPAYPLGQRAGLVTSIPPSARVSQRLRLRHQQDVMFVEEQRPVLLLGRELGNDVVVIDPRASRQHARIERRPEGFVLVDQSTNGTFVSQEGLGERCIKHASAVLTGPGRIGCGFSASEVERDLVFFEII